MADQITDYPELGLTDLITECRRLESIARRFMVLALEAGCDEGVLNIWKNYAQTASMLAARINSDGETHELKDDIRVLQDELRQELEALQQAINERYA